MNCKVNHRLQLKNMKNLIIATFFALMIVSGAFATSQPPIQPDQIQSMLVIHPWKQTQMTVFPAMLVDEELGLTTNDVFEEQSEEARNSIIRFDDFGNYHIVLTQSTVGQDALFAARNGEDNTSSDNEDNTSLANVTELPTVDIIETGGWYVDGNEIVLMADDGRMSETRLQVTDMSATTMTISFARLIDGERYVFSQTFETQPFVDLGW